MQLNERWSNYLAINGVINALIDQKLETYQKIFNKFFKSL